MKLPEILIYCRVFRLKRVCVVLLEREREGKSEIKKEQMGTINPIRITPSEIISRAKSRLDVVQPVSHRCWLTVAGRLEVGHGLPRAVSACMCMCVCENHTANRVIPVH